MKKFYIKIGLILFVHLLSYCSIVLISVFTETLNSRVIAWSFFLIEPFFTLIIYQIINWGIIICILKIKPISDMEKNKVLIAIGIICTVILLCGCVYVYSENWLKEGFSLFLNKSYWMGELFK